MVTRVYIREEGVVFPKFPQGTFSTNQNMEHKFQLYTSLNLFEVGVVLPRFPQATKFKHIIFDLVHELKNSFTTSSVPR